MKERTVFMCEWIEYNVKIKITKFITKFLLHNHCYFTDIQNYLFLNVFKRWLIKIILL
jgi:hypothetical protein